MKVTIDNAIPSIDYSILGKPVGVIDVYYTIDGTYRGQKRMKQDDYDPETIHKVVAADVAHIVGSIGKTVEV